MTFEKYDLFDSYYVRETSAEECYAFYAAKEAEVYHNVSQINTDVWLSETEKGKRQLLSANLQNRITYYALIYHKDEPIGWHYGWQTDAETFYMCESGIVPEHQHKRIYSALLPRLLERYKAIGFQKVTSKHHAANNKVIVPKLKAGFMITGFSIDEGVGLMVDLTYAFNAQRRKIYFFRTGHIRPDDEIRRFL